MLSLRQDGVLRRWALLSSSACHGLLGPQLAHVFPGAQPDDDVVVITQSYTCLQKGSLVCCCVSIYCLRVGYRWKYTTTKEERAGVPYCASPCARTLAVCLGVDLWVRVSTCCSHAERMATPRPRVGQPAWVAEPSLADGAVYALGQVTDQKGEACEVQLTGAAEPIQVPATSCWPVNEPGSHALHDLTELHFVHEAALLAHVSERYKGGSIYTYVGPTLVSLNPFRELPGVYGEEAC